MKTNYKLNPRELKNRWSALTQKARKAIVDRNLGIINDPQSTDRAVGIATKNLIAISELNIQLDQNVSNSGNIEIHIKEDSDNT